MKNSRKTIALNQSTDTISDSLLIEHLLRRAGFGATPTELKSYQLLGYDNVLDMLLNPQRIKADDLQNAIDAQNFDFTNGDDLRRWWFYRMTFSPKPLEEKMALFWHGHFATGMRKVNNPYAMYMQNMLFRKYLLGNFHDLLLAVSQDPAMIVWLDNQQNLKGKPNENYAREVMELFTMGIGNYSETDVKEAARAFTGWQTRPAGFYFNANQHDYGTKMVLGNTGNLNGDDIVSILVAHPATANRLATKLCKYFVADNPDPDLVERVASAYTTSGGEIKPMLKTIFTDPIFFSEKSYHAKIKNPCELVVGTLKTFQIDKLDADLPQVLAKMGQNLFEPPNVKGWDGGAAWISTDTMMERFNFANRITGERFDEIEGYFSPSQLVANEGLNSASAIINYFLSLLVDNDVPDNTRSKLISYVASDIKGVPVTSIPNDSTLNVKLRGAVRLIMTLPTYQLA